MLTNPGYAKSALKVTSVPNPKCNPYKLNCSKWIAQKSNLDMLLKVQSCNIQKSKFQSLLRAASNDNVPRGVSWKVPVLDSPSLISGHWNVHQHWKFRATPETIKVLYKMQSVEAMMHTADKSVIQQRPWKWPKVQLDRSLEVNKVIQVVPVPKCSSIWFPVLPKWSKSNSDRCIKVALLHSESTLHLWYRDVESVK